MPISLRLELPLLPRWARYLAVGIVFTAVTIGSVTERVPSSSLGGFGPFWDKYLHFLAYAALATILAYATVHWRDHQYRRAGIVIFVAVGYGLLMELVQGPLPSRRFSAVDALVNGLGALMVSVWFLLERTIRYRRL
jgi:VanZ family protein